MQGGGKVFTNYKVLFVFASVEANIVILRDTKKVISNVQP